MMVRAYLETPVPNGVAYSPATVAQSVAEGLQAAGHEVTFFGPEGTRLDVQAVETRSMRPVVKTQAELDSFISTTDIFEDYRPSLYDAAMAKDILQRAAAGEYDCVMFHHFESALSTANLFPYVPVIFVLHDYLDENRREALMLHSSKNQHFISISNSQRRDAPDLHYAATVYNGIDTDFFSFNDEPEDYLFFSGRIDPSKGVKEAVQVAIQSNKRLLIAGSLSKSNNWYFDEHIKPFLNDKILFLGMLDKEQLVKYYKMASAVLMPIQWQEPFGLSMAEAGSCGTPVIAFNRGSVPEVIVDGKTGFIVDNSAEMIMAISKISSIKRKDCRDHVLKNFSRDHMIASYVKALEEILVNSTNKPRNRRPSASSKLQKRIVDVSKKLMGA